MHLRQLALALVSVLGVVLAAGACKKPQDTVDASTDEKAPACATFIGGKMTATWTRCPDKIKREIRCATFVNDLKCDCYEDGVSKDWFKGSDPALATRESATRIANANCGWSLELP